MTGDVSAGDCIVAIVADALKLITSTNFLLSVLMAWCSSANVLMLSVSEGLILMAVTIDVP